MILGKKHKILVVDDIPANIMNLVEALREHFELVISTHGEEALRLARAKCQPDLILLDIMMPDMDGYEVCKRLKDDIKTREIPVIFVTVRTGPEDEAKGLSLGAVDYITKPLSIPIAKARIRTHLELALFRKDFAKKVNERTAEIDASLGRDQTDS